MTWEELKEKAKEILCIHNYRYTGVDYTHTPYIYFIECKKCGKKKYLFGKRPKCPKVSNKEFCAIDNELTSFMRKNGVLPKCISCDGFRKEL